jgi:hypothetical protein
MGHSCRSLSKVMLSMSDTFLLPAKRLESVSALEGLIDENPADFVRKTIALLADHPDLRHPLDEALDNPQTPDHLQITYHTIWFVRMGLFSRLQSNTIKKSSISDASLHSLSPEMAGLLLNYFKDQIDLARDAVNGIEALLRLFESLIRGAQNYALLHTADDVWSDHLLAPVTPETLYGRFGWTFVTDALWLQKANTLAKALRYYPVGGMSETHPFAHARDYMIPHGRVVTTFSQLLLTREQRQHCVEGMAELLSFTQVIWDTLDSCVARNLASKLPDAA